MHPLASVHATILDVLVAGGAGSTSPERLAGLNGILDDLGDAFSA